VRVAYIFLGLLAVVFRLRSKKSVHEWGIFSSFSSARSVALKTSFFQKQQINLLCVELNSRIIAFSNNIAVLMTREIFQHPLTRGVCVIRNWKQEFCGYYRFLKQSTLSNHSRASREEEYKDTRTNQNPRAERSHKKGKKISLFISTTTSKKTKSVLTSRWCFESIRVRHARYAISFELKIEQRAMRSKWEHLVSFEQSDEEHKHRSRNRKWDTKKGEKISLFCIRQLPSLFSTTTHGKTFSIRDV
jgi:hypothetical protein